VQNTLHRRGLTDATRRNVLLLEGQQSSLGFARIVAGLVAVDVKPDPPSGLLLRIRA
jgi:hypothetical protein